MEKIYIAGAHSRGRTLRVYLEYLFSRTKVEAFLVDDMSENEKEVDGLPVRLIAKNLHKDYPVYIGTRGVNHSKIREELEWAGMKKIIPVTAKLDSRLRNEFVRRYYNSRQRKFIRIDQLPSPKSTVINQTEKTAKIYVIGSVHDQPLQSKYRLSRDEIILQAGAALTKSRIRDNVLTDCTGDNISFRNYQYCELTGLYWIWKHAREEYVGLAHYRRHFLLPDDWLKRMEENGIDVILPVPLYVRPNLEEDYKNRHLPEEWEYMMMYFKEKLPEEYSPAQEIFQGNLYSPCNMFVMRKEVLHDLCGWLFPIIDAVVKHGGEKENPYMNRYPGFLSERLITFFFESRQSRYQVAYANKNFLS